MLTLEYWLGSRAPADGVTDRIALDLDCSDPAELLALHKLYREIRYIFGHDRIPLVWRTPSGVGIRVVYRIPRTPLEDVITDLRTGLVADVLRGHGIPVEKGVVEIFPQKGQADRLPLGRNMPLLDPDNLSPLGHAAIGDTYDPDFLEQALEEVEAWYAREYPDLLLHLRSLPQERLIGATQPSNSIVSLPLDQDGQRLPGRILRLVESGLSRAGTRTESEWLVATAFVLDPSSFPEYGLGARPTDQELANALACWLASKNNGYSKDWRRSVQRLGSREMAILYWTEEYLRRSSTTGENLFDRVRQAIVRQDPLFRRVTQLSHEERNHLLSIAGEVFDPGAERYKFECWLSTWLRAVKETIRFHESRGTELDSRPGPNGREQVKVEIAATRMLEWPYGRGKDSETGQRKYRFYREVLEETGLMTWATPYYNPRFGNPAYPAEVTGTATGYWVDWPDFSVTVRDMGVAPWDLKEAIQDITIHGRALTLDEAYHALHVVESGINLTERYKRSAAGRIHSYANTIRDQLALSQSTEDKAALLLEATVTDAPVERAA